MDTITLLWTSGWDSTFRLLQIILVEKKQVQPIYIIDIHRKSLKQEQAAIYKILNTISQKYPEARKLIQPVWYVKKDDLPINEEITTSFSKLVSIRKTGNQYEWLAQFCHNYKLKNVEISFEKNSNTSSLGNFLKKNYLEVNESELINKDLYNTIDIIFKYFNFPVINLLKTDMLTIAKENQWEDLMNLTWFCHKPKNNQPCGKCNPCKDTIIKGLAFRIPFKNRISGYYKIFVKNKLNW